MVKLRRIRIENFTILKEIMGKDSLEINFTDNPICIIIPCHRVVGSNGNLICYGGGIKNKAALLTHEQKHI